MEAKQSSNFKATLKTRKKLSDRDARYMLRLIRVHGHRTTSSIHKELKKQGFTGAQKTVLRKLKSMPSLRQRSPRQRQCFTKAQRQQRLQWARATLARKIDWTTATFADEKVWQLDGPIRRPRLWCDVRDPQPCLRRKGALSRSVAFWGAFSLRHVPDLIRVPAHVDTATYCDTIGNALLPELSNRRRVLYHDRQTAHHSKRTEKWLAENKVQARLFPPRAADLNPIENLWSIVSRRVYGGTKTYNSVDSLSAAIRSAWATIQMDRGLRKNLIGSMSRRLKQVVERKGEPADF